MTTPPPSGALRACRALWEARLAEAKTAYERAVGEMEDILKQEDTAKLSSDLVLARRLAFFREAEAREEYVRVLRIYADLVVHNTQPEE